MADEPTDYQRLRLVAEDLFMLCRRATANLNRGNESRAREILSHALRIAEKVGIKESIIRTTVMADHAAKDEEIARLNQQKQAALDKLKNFRPTIEVVEALTLG